MPEYIERPSVPAGKPEDQIYTMYRYLCTMAETMNINLQEIGGNALTEEEQRLMNDLSIDRRTGQRDQGVPEGFGGQEMVTLKSLIIKTAEFVKTQLDQYRIVLFGETEATGQFGDYRKKQGLRVDVTPEGVKQTMTYAEIVRGLRTYEVNSKNYIKTGYLRTENGIPIYGVAIGKDVVTFAENGVETYHDENKVAELTADELSFFIGGVKTVSYSGTKISFLSGGEEVMYIQGGKIYVVKDLTITSTGALALIGARAEIKSSSTLTIEGSTVKIQSGSTFDVEATNFRIDSVNKYMQTGQWKFYDKGMILSTTKDRTVQYLDGSTVVVQTDPVDMFIGDKDRSQAVSGRAYAGMELSAAYMAYGRDYYIVPQIRFMFKSPNESVARGVTLDSGGIGPAGGSRFGITGVGNIYADNYLNNSSREIKHDIKPLQPAGERLDRLQPVSFVYNEDKTGRIQYGLIHEETVGILPEICIGDIEADPKEKAINYMALVPMLLKEIQELRARVSELERRRNNG